MSEESPNILEFVDKILVAGAQSFVCNKATLGAANIGWIGSNFRKHFLNKREQDVPDAHLVVNNLIQPSLGDSILKKLGDEAETTLTYMINLITNQAHIEDGPLLIRERSTNIFPIRGLDNNLWAVRASSRPQRCYWEVEAHPICELPNRWHGKIRVFFRRDS